MSGSPILVGVTGGIGSGKTTVCKLFETLGHQVYYADDKAKWLMENNDVLVSQIKVLFGEEAYKEGKLNRKLIADRVFVDQELLTELNAKVHPAVAEDLKSWVASHAKEKILFDEAALLFEVGSYKNMNFNILVTAPEEIRIDRVVARDSHRTREGVRAIMEKQMSDQEKIPLADFVINNDGKQSLVKQVMELYPQLS